MNKYILVFVVLFAILGRTYAQSNKFHVDLNYNYNLGLSEKYVGRSYCRSSYKMGGNSLRLATRYDISKDLSAGVGIGLDRYTEPDFNTMPVFATLRYTPLKKAQDAYVFTDLGYAVKAGDDFFPGFTGKLGVGYLVYVSKHFGVNIQIAYDFKDFRKIQTLYYDTTTQKGTIYNSTSTRHSISFGVGVTF